VSIKSIIAILSALIGLSPQLPASQPGTSLSVTPAVESNAILVKAAQINRDQVKNLEWEFGGTRQRGLYLYVPIITQIIGDSSSFDSPGFAAALAAWQQQQGLSTSGVLDKDTWMRMVAVLQENRLKSREYPAMEELTVVSPQEFFDPTRRDDLRKVHVRAYDAFKRMVEAARADKMVAAALTDPNNPEARNYFKIISSWRSREYQEELRKHQSGGLGRVALAKNSPHFTGRALDIYVGGLPVSTDDKNRAIQVSTPVYQWLVRNAPRFGFRPYFYEPWHWEFVGDSDSNESLRVQVPVSFPGMKSCYR
jgi:zinc D-Ala-D-Ala carboxypeptidase